METLYEWIGFIVFWTVVCVGLIGAAFWAWFFISTSTSVFGYEVMKADDAWRLERVSNRAAECHRWFSGFKDLDLIWDYIFQTGGPHDINEVRRRYAEMRGTDQYGKAK